MTPSGSQSGGVFGSGPAVRAAFVILVVISFVVLFYEVENFLGRRAWITCRQALAAQGAALDNPLPGTNAVPDRLNILKAPGMAEWFAGQSLNDLASRLNQARTTQPRSDCLIEITVVSRTNRAALLNSDLCLDYEPPLLGLANPLELGPPAFNRHQVIPLIVMDQVPLSLAIKNLALQEGRKYQMDSNIISSWTDAGLPEPSVNLRWENVTAFQALTSLLSNYNLEWLQDPTNPIGHIKIKSDFSSLVQMTDSARGRLKEIEAQVSSLASPGVHTLKASQDFILYHQDGVSPGKPIQPVRITLRSENVPSVKEVEAIFPGALPRFPGRPWLKTVPSGTNAFRVFSGPPRFCSAEDYLASTDQWKPDFDLMRAALKRPYARIDGDCNRALSSPRNFVGIRIVSQTLAQRAQSCLLLGRPEQAVQELTLLHDLSAVVEAEPLSLVAAMIEVATTGLYVEVLHDGLRIGAWREPQLTALQRQLEKIHLGPVFVRGIAGERAVICRTLETAGATDFVRGFDPTRGPLTFAEELKNPLFFVVTFGPTGWRYQSLAASATLLQNNIACFDRVNQTLRPSDVERADPEASLQRGSPRTSLARVATPGLLRAWQTMAHKQTTVDHAFIACALERFRLAHGEFPGDLSSLTPDFANRLPHPIIAGDRFYYRRLDSSHYELYSSGWNQGRRSASAPAGLSPQQTTSDWAWN